MWFNDLWQRWMGQAPRQLRRRCRPASTRTRLTLEALEDRTLPSGGIVNSTAGLIAAINSANSSGTPTTITLQAGANFGFTSGYNSTLEALPFITGKITIVGNNDVLVRTAAPSTPFRLFDVASGGSLTLENLTLQGGFVQGAPTVGAEGGAVFSSGTLKLSGVTVRSNIAKAGSGLNAPSGEGSRGIGGVGAAAFGGGLYVAGGSVTLKNDIFSGNLAIGGNGGHGSFDSKKGTKGGNGGNGGLAAGGGIYVAGGSFSLRDDTFSSNHAIGGEGGRGGNGAKIGNDGQYSGGNGGAGAEGMGGGLYVARAGSLTLSNDTFSGNLAAGGSGGFAGNAAKGGNCGSGVGGGLYVATAGDLTLRQITFSGNFAVGGSSGGHGGNGAAGGTGGAGAEGAGGGLYVATASSLTLSQDTLSSNFAIGGNGGNGGNDTSAFGSVTGAVPGGTGGAGAIGCGGGLYVGQGSITLVNDTLAGNHALGGIGGNGGRGANGGTIFGFGHNGDAGGPGGAGGAGEGGGLYVNQGSVTLLNDTLSGNLAQGSAGGSGGVGGNAGNGLFTQGRAGTGGAGGAGGNAEGGGFFVPAFNITYGLANTLIAENNLVAGTGGAGGVGGRGIGSNAGANGANGLAGFASGPDVSGSVVSSDHDLIGNSSGSFGFTTAHGDILNPSSVGLGPLANNGGPTQTMALLSGSPAIDTGDSHAHGLPATDQRGFARIVGKAVDIGAYEFGATKAATDLSIHGTAPAGVTAGGQIIFQLTVTNSSSTAQSHVALTENLPANTTLVSWVPAAGWNHSAPAADSRSGTVTAWTGSLAAGSSATCILVVQVNSGTPAGTVLSTRASLGPVTDSADPASSISLTTTVVAPVNVSADVSVKRSSLTYDSALHEFVQTITLTNTSDRTLLGPLALQLTNLSSNATLANANGTNANGNPYIDFLSAGHSLAAGKSITVTLYFQDPSKQGISYDTQVWKDL